METCPSRIWICSNSPPAAWQSLAQVLRRSCGANLAIPAFAAYSRTTCQTDFSVSLSPQAFPILCTRRNNLPDVRFAASTHWSSTFFTHAGIGMVRVCPAFPLRSTMPSVPHAVEYGRSLVQLLHGVLRHTLARWSEALDPVSPSSACHLEPATISATVRL